MITEAIFFLAKISIRKNFFRKQVYIIEISCSPSVRQRKTFLSQKSFLSQKMFYVTDKSFFHRKCFIPQITIFIREKNVLSQRQVDKNLIYKDIVYTDFCL